MCGIVGYVGNRDAAPLLLSALKRLEYRGYDSAGIAVATSGVVDIRRAKGKIANLEEVVEADPIAGQVGIGHTRWATHGAPEVRNAHPHLAASEPSRIAVVHNGIIENHASLRARLVAQGAVFVSDTDTEVICHLAAYHAAQGLGPRDAARATFAELEGNFAVALLFEAETDRLYMSRRGAPLVIGHGDGEMFIGSDAIALAPLTRRLTYLGEGDFVSISANDFDILDAEGNAVDRPETISTVDASDVEQGAYAHFMRKEIDEQPEAVSRTLTHYLSGQDGVENIDIDFTQFDRVLMVACGTAYYACLTSRYWFEREAGLPVDLDIASEFRYREPPIPARTLAIFVSQSGETADTLAALEYARNKGAHCVAVVNAPESSIARGSHVTMPIFAGPEIGVASTKAFTCQLTALAILALKAGQDRATLSIEDQKTMRTALSALPGYIRSSLATETALAAISDDLAAARDMIFLGRGAMHAIALEGALKLKEISYIHAEGYAAGELKHGPLALVDDAVPVISLTPNDWLSDKMLSNVEEVLARKGKVVLIGDADDGLTVPYRIAMPSVPDVVAPIVYAVPMQLLAYHVALARGTDVDRPRNLAKSVTTE
jgi:glutamine---fructose-6-phosphate transaminase (isomerizing)